MRADLLEGTNKLLMTMYLENGNTFRQMAQLMGVSESTVKRQIHKLTERLIDGEYITCLRNREKFSKEELDIAKDYFLLGLSIKKIAIKRDLTYYAVRRTLKKIQRFITALEPAKKG